MGTQVSERLSNAFSVAASAVGKAGVVVLRGAAIAGGVVVAGAGMYALTQTFIHHATDSAAYAFPLVTIPFGVGLATVGAVPKKVLNFMDKMF